MAKSRVIRHAILGSEKVCSMGIKAQLFFFKLLLVADDYGLFDARAHILRGVLYSASLDKTSKSDIDCHLAECERADILVCYFVDGKRYGLIRDFGQRAQSEPKHPIPDGWQVVKGANATIAPRIPQQFTASHGESRRVTASHGESPFSTVGNRESENLLNINTVTENAQKSTVNHGESPWKTAIVVDGDGDDNNYYNSAGEREQVPECVKRSLQPSEPPRYPTTTEEVGEALPSLVDCSKLQDTMPELCAKYLASRKSIGWQLKGSYIVNWRVDLRSYATAWIKNLNTKKQTSNRKITDYDDFDI